jgi:DNA-binding NarL/FixJ family response regulator
MIKIIIADDHVMFRESISKMLTMKKIADVIAEAGNGVELIELLDNQTPDLILMDISMPEMDGIEATKKAIEKQPGLKILTLSSFGDEQYYFNMVEAGAKGFVLKNTSLSELEKAIKVIANGGSWFSSELLQKVILNISNKPKKDLPVDLSEREMEILKLICENFTNEQIAEKISLSYDTVKWHRANILSKTGCNNAIGLLLFALKHKIIVI